jgi:hypothetical protein
MSMEELLSSIKSLTYHDKLVLMECLRDDISKENTEQLSLEERKKKFFQEVEACRFSLPSDYRFDREEANAR